MHRDADQYGVTRIVQLEILPAISGYQAFTADHLTLHTDGSSVPEPATFVVLWCAHPAETGGQSIFMDGKRLYQCLASHHPKILEVLSTPGSAIFAGMEPPLHSSIFSIVAEKKIYIRFRNDNLGHYTPAIMSILPGLLELLGHYSITFKLHENQGYILQNGRWLHGRTAFQGQREMYRVLLHHCEGTLLESIHLGFDPIR
jgi:alpha-ketoglutarate-dependent taurine dioxygenase